MLPIISDQDCRKDDGAAKLAPFSARRQRRRGLRLIQETSGRDEFRFIYSLNPWTPAEAGDHDERTDHRNAVRYSRVRSQHRRLHHVLSSDANENNRTTDSTTEPRQVRPPIPPSAREGVQVLARAKRTASGQAQTASRRAIGAGLTAKLRRRKSGWPKSCIVI